MSVPTKQSVTYAGSVHSPTAYRERRMHVNAILNIV